MLHLFIAIALAAGPTSRPVSTRPVNQKLVDIANGLEFLRLERARLAKGAPILPQSIGRDVTPRIQRVAPDKVRMDIVDRETKELIALRKSEATEIPQSSCANWAERELLDVRQRAAHQIKLIDDKEPTQALRMLNGRVYKTVDQQKRENAKNRAEMVLIDREATQELDLIQKCAWLRLPPASAPAMVAKRRSGHAKP